ncbi:MAG: hypothetical protein NUV68_05000 [Caldiserica bacterium]|nr:hypothetical protein [Caldisericota bacterium]MDH7562688.1 hypothetical protein [Caldisericota bacterium]
MPKIRERFRKKLSARGIPPGKPLILTGHQPHFIHPGIWFRYFLLERLNQEGFSVSAFILDSDFNSKISALVPFQARDEIFLKEVVLPLERKVFESLSSPSKEQWVDFINEIRESLNFPEGLRARENFSRVFHFEHREEPYPRFWSRLRRFFEGDPQYSEFPLSEVLNEEFHLFVLHIASNGERFLEAFQRATESWRKEKRTENRSLPFPDLKIHSGKIELPFWFLLQGERFPVFLNPGRNLQASGIESKGLEDPSFLEKVRPRASTLTMFLRLVGCDLFIHGTGGGTYEQAVDFILEDFFEIDPPPFIQATLTMYFPGFDFHEQRRVESLLREMRKSPEDFLPPEAKRENQELISRKNQLRGIKLDREGFRELERINKTLLSLLEDQVRSLEEKAGALLKKKEVLGSREFPFFFFHPRDLRSKAFQK